ncbi:l-aminoadipate-semialdehyde dehydrogenase [Moniliophthora roreri MCA 2997]|uniref:L-aminoadipate-semialdehyde dehydrogenase n=1 Tax=Moniliophthora roreri (strain MCA 2997) TaxID=1381753 RepID=V2X0Q5_MONRO|nr:l-aminoadipate-semialdehyde dehydrogenase [Moniliophthora roreri MCA 2997]
MPAVVYKAKSTTELIELRARQQPDDPAIYTGIPESDNSIKLRSLSYSDILRAVDRLAWHYALLLTPKLKPGEIPPPQIIAVLVTSAIDETLLELALAKLGLTALLLSVNNSVAAVAHLSKLTNATHVIYSPKFSEDAREARELLMKEGYELGLVEDKRFPLWGEGGIQTTNVKPFAAPLTPEQEADRPAVILHSSGSTGFPKPVYISHYGLIANIAINQNKPGFSTLPVFHGYGHYALFRCMYPGKPMTLFPPHLPLTSANICAVHAASPPTNQCFAVPYVIKLLGETEEGTRMLASFDVVSFAGAPLPEDLGDRLTDAGVNLLSIYGITETGSLMNSERDFATDKGWKWVRPFTSSKPYLRFEPQGNDTFEVVVLDGYPPKIQSNRPDNSFATKDLFLRNPECENQYRYIGRLDDTLVHILGEKTNPVPMELCIRGNSPYVAEAVVFGAGKPQTGVLILPSELGKDLSKAQLMEKVWPVIELANSEAPSHSRILPEMVDFLPYGTHVPVATKMSILRPACYAKFKNVIEDIYSRFEAGSNDQQKLRLTTQEEMEKYLLGTIARAVGPVKATKLTRDVDLFAFGVDSLQATRVRNSCWKELDLGKDVSLGQNVVYEHPSIERLAQYIFSLQSGQPQSSTASHQEKMLALLEKYAARLQSRKATPHALPRPVEERVVLLTGATGSLGAHILHQLVSSPIRKVICLSRATSHAESRHRVKYSLKQRMLPIPEDNKWDSYAADPNVNNLGLTKDEYEAIKAEVTDVVHNAWPVNFVLAVDSFDVHIGGAVNLMNLCLQSPYAKSTVFYYSSSVSCRQGSHDPTCVEDYPSDPSTAASTGYAQSKWVVEKLCERAAKEKNLRVGVLRIGQMVGDTVNGVWNETEAWPLLLKSASTVAALPVLDEHPQWLPVDYAGRGIAEIILQDSPHQVYHIVNPDTSSSWNDILDGLEQAGLKFERVNRKEWVQRLAASDQDGERNPTIKLLDFFRDRWSGRTRRPMFFKTNQTERVTKSIKESPPVTKGLIAKWVKNWGNSGFLS